MGFLLSSRLVSTHFMWTHFIISVNFLSLSPFTDKNTFQIAKISVEICQSHLPKVTGTDNREAYPVTWPRILFLTCAWIESSKMAWIKLDRERTGSSWKPTLFVKLALLQPPLSFETKPANWKPKSYHVMRNPFSRVYSRSVVRWKSRIISIMNSVI